MVQVGGLADPDHLVEVEVEAYQRRPGVVMLVVPSGSARPRYRSPGQAVGAIDRPACWCFVGVTHTDDPATAARLAEKVWNLRILRR